MAAALGPGREPATLLADLPVKGYDGPVRVWGLVEGDPQAGRYAKGDLEP